MIADEGQFLKTIEDEHVDILVKKCTHGHRQTGVFFFFKKLIFAVYLTLRLSFFYVFIFYSSVFANLSEI